MKRIWVKRYHDAGHGWYRVSRAVIKRLGLENKVSEYSYQSKGGHSVYLEEDADFPLFLSRLRELDIDRDKVIQFEREVYSHRSRVRRLESYKRGVESWNFWKGYGNQD